METSETSPLITKFRSAHLMGMEALNDSSRNLIRRRFLARAKRIFLALYGPESSIVQKYIVILRRKERIISKDELATFFTEFNHIYDYLKFMSGQETANAISQPSVPPAGKNVFIIHGHDEMNTLRLKDLLQDHFSLSPVLMRSKPGMSRALLEKFEHSASVCTLAFAIITPDDKIINREESYYQARPNVIFEAGWFVGRLGISRVCLLLKNGTTVQTDIDGISRIHFQDDITDKAVEIQRELQAAELLGT